jgi:hypothetical protein
VTAAAVVPLEPGQALALWSDVSRWPSFVEGLARVGEPSAAWPEPGSKVIWESGPGGRGRVTEKVVECSHARFATELFEQRLRGRQTAEFGPAGDGGARVALALDYELVRGGPLGLVTGVLFTRRALRDALARTLRRFAVEAEDEAGLR